MKTIILCGGEGTRMKEETEFKPKPLVLVGGKPILWHIMKIYSHYGYNEFVLALGYKGNMIKEYFLHERTLVNDFTLDTANGKTEFHGNGENGFKITFAETGLNTETGQRVKLCRKYLGNENFMVTYGDGVSDVNIPELVRFHGEQGKIGVITGVHPRSKFGLFKVDEKKNIVSHFQQKPLLDDYVNGGFMVFRNEIFDYLDDGPIENVFPRLIKNTELSLYKHDGFWQAMDTYKEMRELNEKWADGNPWAVWMK